MRVPYEWLKEFVNIDIEPEELAKRVTMRGLEVEAIEKIVPLFNGIVIGKIVDTMNHPSSDTLTLCKVDTGKDILPIVCGAKNFQVGDKVPLAAVGAHIGKFTIERKKIRGEISEGMLCSEKELGLSDDHAGIFLLPDDFPVGAKLEDMAGIKDVIFDINVPPNRGDLLSIYGIAREIGAIVDMKPQLPVFGETVAIGGDVQDYVALDIGDTEACPRYVLKMIQGITIKPSPFWMRRRIIKCGMRPINSIVDVTNYIMLELGQPLHAFDFNKIRRRRIEVKLTGEAMQFRTLDGIDRNLVRGDLLICDGDGPVAIAGIMGGENSEITADTKDVALESAYFNPFFIRRTARRLGIKSEASLRFEKGIDVNTAGIAADRAVQLMSKISGGTVLDGKREVYHLKERKNIYITHDRLNQLLGVSIDHETVKKALQSIDIEILRENQSALLLAIPQFRHDIAEFADIVEEVARIYSYDYIPATMPVIHTQANKRDSREIFIERTKNYLRSSGLTELINFAFFNGKDIENFSLPVDDDRNIFVRIMNPISKEYEFMRTFMVPNVLKNVAYNCNRGEKNLMFFELGKVFFETEEGLPMERMAIVLTMTGKEREYFWRDKQNDLDFYDLKGVIEGLFQTLSLDCSFAVGDEPFLKRGKSANVYIGNEKVGWIGEVIDNALKAYEIEQRVFCAELRYDILLRKAVSYAVYKPISRYPQVVRDFSLIIDENVPVSMLTDRIRDVSPLVTSVGVFDVFLKDVKSVALRVVFQSYEDTLKDEEINGIQNRIIEELTAIQGVVLRQ